MLLPLSETRLLGLDLLGKALAKLLLFLLEFGVIHLLHLWFPKFPCLHLLLSVVLVVELFGSRDQVQHVRPDQKRAQLAEIAVALVLDLRNTPEVLATLDHTPVWGLYIFSRADDRERHGIGKHTSVLCSGLVLSLDGGLINANSLRGDDLPDALLEDEEIILGHSVGFGDDGEKIDTRAETLHDLNVKRLQTISQICMSIYGRMAYTLNKLTCVQWA